MPAASGTAAHRAAAHMIGTRYGEVRIADLPRIAHRDRGGRTAPELRWGQVPFTTDFAPLCRLGRLLSEL